MTLRVMLTSAGAKVPLLRALEHAVKTLSPTGQVIAADLSDHVVCRYLANEFWAMPATEDAQLDNILRGCQRRNITHILPSRDGELLFWAKHQAFFRQHGVDILVAPTDAITQCLDKLTFAQLTTDFDGLIIPASRRADDLSAKRLVVKERFGAGSQSLGLDLDHSQAQQHAQLLSHPIFQPFVKGQEISIDAWLSRDHQLKGHICRYREKVVHGESQISSTVTLPQFDSVIRALLERLRLSGPVVLQAIIDNDGGLNVIECNSRFGGASTLGIRAGVDSLYWSLAESLGHDLTTLPFTPASQPIRQVRHASDHYL